MPPSSVIGQGGNERAGQTFTAQNTGALTRAQVEIDKIGSAGDWILSINAVDGSGIPTDTVLATTTIPDASVPNGVGTLTGDFASPATVTAGQKYAVVFTRPASDTLRIRYSVSNPCPEFAFHSFGPTGPFPRVCGPDGDPDDPCDLVFAVFVTPPPAAASNAFTLGGVKGKTLTLNVSSAGTAVVDDASAQSAGSRATAAAKKLLKTSTATGGPGIIQVTLKLTKAAKQKLGQKGKVRVNARITFTPHGGTANSQTATLKIKRKK